MRYANELRLRFVGDPELAQQFIGRGRVLMGALLNQMQLSGNTLGSRQVQDADGVVYRVMVMGSVPILEIDVSNVPARLADDPGTFVVWPAENANIYAFGDNPQVLLEPPGEEAGIWRAVFFDDAAKPEDADGGFYAPTFPDGVTRQGNVDWTASDGTWSVRWHGPRSRYFPEPRTANNLQPAYGVFDAKTGVFMKGQLLVDVDDYASVIGETSLYVKGAAVQRTASAAKLIVVVARYIGDLSNTELNRVREWVLSFEITPNDPRAPEYSVVSGSARSLGARYDAEEYRSDHPWYFNDDASEARTIRYAYFSDKVHVREVKLEVGTSATWDVVETVQIPDVVNTSVVNNADNIVVAESFHQGYNWFPQNDATTPELFTTNMAEFPGSTSQYSAFDRPLSGTDLRSYVHTIAQTPEKVKAAVDFHRGEWVYAYALLRNNRQEFSDTITKSHSVANLASVGGYTMHESSGGGSFWIEFRATEESTHEFSRTSVKTISQRYGGIETGFLTRESLRTVDYSGSAAGSGSWTRGRDHSIGTREGGAIPLNESASGSGSVSGTVNSTAVDTRIDIAWLDLRSESAIIAEKVSTTVDQRTLTQASTVVPSQVSLPVTISPNHTLTISRAWTYRVFASGEEVFSETIESTPEVSNSTPTWSQELGARHPDMHVVRAVSEPDFLLDWSPPDIGGDPFGDSTSAADPTPYVDRYVSTTGSVTLGPININRKDHDAFAHYGSVAVSPTAPSAFVWAIGMVDPPVSLGGATWRAGISNGDIYEKTGRASGAPMAPVWHMPPTRPTQE